MRGKTSFKLRQNGCFQPPILFPEHS